MPDRFIWLKENGRMCAQKWPREGLGRSDGRTIAAEHIISHEEAKWPINELASKYPPPSVTGEVFGPYDEIPEAS